jgi:hypothetical protein
MLCKSLWKFNLPYVLDSFINKPVVKWSSSLIGGFSSRLLADLVSTPRRGAAWRLDLAPFTPFDVVNEKVAEKKKGLAQELNIYHPDI